MTLISRRWQRQGRAPPFPSNSWAKFPWEGTAYSGWEELLLFVNLSLKCPHRQQSPELIKVSLIKATYHTLTTWEKRFFVILYSAYVCVIPPSHMGMG